MSRSTPNLTDIPELAPYVRSRQLAPGEVLFSQGEVPTHVYQVRSGILKLSCMSPVGREIITELLFPGDCCDLLAAFDAQPYAVSGAAVAQQAVEVDCVPRECFAQLAERNPLVAERLLTGWRRRLQFQREMMVAIAVERAEQRALRALLMLGERLGHAVGATLELAMPLTRQEFSELIGTTMETAIRVLSRLKKEHLVSEQGGHLTLPTLSRMRELCAA